MSAYVPVMILLAVVMAVVLIPEIAAAQSSSGGGIGGTGVTVDDIFKAFSGESDPQKRSITLRVVLAVKAVMIPALAWMFEQFYAMLAPAIAAFMVLYVAVFGIQVATGAVRNPRGDFAMTAIKMAAAYSFAASMGSWAPMIFDGVDELTAIFAKVLTQNFFGCTADQLIPAGLNVSNPDQYLVWKQLDCVFVKFLGFSAVGVGASIFAGFMASSAISEYFGPLITVAGIGGFVGFLFAILRVTYTYIVSIIGLAFMIILAPLFVPMVLFQATNSYFQKWVANLGAFFLQPAMQMALVAFMTQVFATTIFTSDHSVMAVLMCNAGSANAAPAKGCESTCANLKNIDAFSMDCLLSAMEQKYIINQQTANSAQYQAMKKEITGGVRDLPQLLFDSALRGGENNSISGVTNQSFNASWQIFSSMNLLPPDVLANESSPQQRFQALMKSGQIIISFMVMIIISMAMFTMLEIMPNMIRQLIGRSYRLGNAMYTIPLENNFRQGLAQFQSAATSGASILPGAMNDDPNQTTQRWTSAALSGFQKFVTTMPLGQSMWAGGNSLFSDQNASDPKQ